MISLSVFFLKFR